MKIAFAGFGEVNTPIEVIEKKCEKALKDLKKSGAEIHSFYPIRDDYEERYVNNAINYFKDKDFDAMVVCIAGWIPTHAVIKVVDCFRNKPMVLWGLCGWYEDGRLVTTADQAGTSAIRKTFYDLGYNFKYVYDIVGKESNYQKVIDYCNLCSVKESLRRVKIGQMGFRDMQLYGTMCDIVSVRNKFGIEVECFEMLEVVQRAEKIDRQEIKKIIAQRVDKWEFQKPADEEAKEKAVKYYLAIKQIIDERGYKAISLKDVDGFKKLLGFPPAPIFTLLGEDGICTIPENDCMGNITQIIANALTGQIACYLEFYEFFSDGVLAGVPDYVPDEVVDGKTKILPASFGELSQGLLNVSKVKTGTVTLCRLTTIGGKYFMHVVVGQGENPPCWEECGWDKPAPQLPSLKIKLDDTETFAESVMCQHYVVTYGDNSKIIKEFCKLNNIEII